MLLVIQVESARPVVTARGSDFVLPQFLLPARHSYATRQTLAFNDALNEF
jgi:hypothetical protein